VIRLVRSGIIPLSKSLTISLITEPVMQLSSLSLLAVLTFVLIAVFVSPALADCPLVNGSFETRSGGYTPGNQPDRIFNDLSLVVPGWNFAIGLSSDLYRDQNESGAQSSYYNAADGDYLAGSGSFFPLNEGIEQTLVVAPATMYEVTFVMAREGSTTVAPGSRTRRSVRAGAFRSRGRCLPPSTRPSTTTSRTSKPPGPPTRSSGRRTRSSSPWGAIKSRFE
jgi:hypothetical protein